MLSDFNLWFETQMKKTVIDRICSENFLVPDLTLADLTEQEKSVFRKKVQNYNRITGMPRPTVEQVEPYLVECKNDDLFRCLEFAIAPIRAIDCFKETPRCIAAWDILFRDMEALKPENRGKIKLQNVAKIDGAKTNVKING